MKYGICLLSQIPMRAEPSEKSEMVSQILFGEYFKINEINGSWSHVHLFDDDYEGWIDSKMLTPLSDEGYQRLKSIPAIYLQDLFPTWLEPLGPLTMPPASRIPEDIIEDAVFFEDFKLHVPGTIAEKKHATVIELAEKWLNTPYLWGGKTPFGFDCSGFVQVIYKSLGILLPRDASQQAGTGESIDFLYTAEPGDLAFFDNEEGIITHVGFIYSPGKIIHCSGSVKIDQIDQQGIYNKVQNKYTHKLRLIKRIPAQD